MKYCTGWKYDMRILLPQGEAICHDGPDGHNGRDGLIEERKKNALGSVRDDTKDNK
ncbi:MAG: hypothetical protein PHO32_02400 [Candidatus Cloacimonetes bacterium]|nr:hypothetical protein [Candidatus Cloacimonadota bacterium]